MARRLVAVLTAAMFGLTWAVNPLSAPEADAAASARTRAQAVFTASRPISARVSSEFGWRLNPILHSWRMHSGIDFAGRCGAPVRAAAAGVVIRAGWAGGYGNQVVINHGRHRGVVLTTTYNHLSRFVVRRGHVARGQIIARVGSTGHSTGCHLHFETHQNGRAVNPRLWFGRNLALTRSVRSATLTKSVQRALHIKADGAWGPATQKAAAAVIHRNLRNVRYLQARVGVTRSGVWGRTSQAALVVTIKRLQKAIGVKADG
ncbi:MAG: M23 family metallopeptidase, partial [Chloroflexota bacterium]